MPPTGVRDALHRGKQFARKGFEKAKRRNLGTGSLDHHAPTLEEIRDELGFAVRPQHLERYREYEIVYKEEEKERELTWKNFLSTGNDNDSDDDGWCNVENALRKGEDDSYVDELTKIVRGGVPAALRGELWLVFSGAKERREREEGEYQRLLDKHEKMTVVKPTLEKWASQIEKDLPRTFPGNPKLGIEKLDRLRRILTAYALHNPEVGYCQAMNFLAALLLLLMPEELAFWTFTCIIDDYFKGYYTERMTEAQVDQLVFVEVVREHFPKLAKHLDDIEVEISWFSGAWFLSLFVNVLPWESVLRVWDVLLHEGNRSMLFRTALALLEKHADAIVAEKDNGTVLLMLQSIGETTFDSSQLVLSACYGFPTVDEELLETLRDRHRPAVLAALHQRSLDTRKWRTAKLEQTTSNGCALPTTAEVDELTSTQNGTNEEEAATLEPQFSAPKLDEERNGFRALDGEEKATLNYQLSAPHNFHQLEPLGRKQKGGFISRIDETDEESKDSEVSRLRTELERALQAQEEAECRAEILKDALTEMERSGRQVSLKVEELERQVARLKQEKEDQSQATVQVILRLQQDKRVLEEARQRAVEEAEENRQIANKTMGRITDDLEAMEKRAVMAESMLEAIENQAAEELRAMEKRAVMAESMLEATLDFHAGAAPRSKRSSDVKLKDNEPKAKETPRFHKHTYSQYFLNSHAISFLPLPPYWQACINTSSVDLGWGSGIQQWTEVSMQASSRKQDILLLSIKQVFWDAHSRIETSSCGRITQSRCQDEVVILKQCIERRLQVSVDKRRKCFVIEQYWLQGFIFFSSIGFIFFDSVGLEFLYGVAHRSVRPVFKA